MLVSAICPTYNRRHLIPVAIASFLAQDWPEKELVIVNDGDEGISDLIPAGAPNIRYLRVTSRKTIGEKRNIACDAARGEVIATFDDDDWSAPTRISQQMELLQMSGKAMVGFNRLLFWDGARAYRYVNESPVYTTGTSMMYRKAFWEKHNFQNVDRAEDNYFCFEAQNTGDVIAVDGEQLIVARLHDNNTFNYRNLGSEQFPPVPPTEIPVEFFEAVRKHPVISLQ